MRKFQTILFAVLTIAGLMASADVSAQSSTTTRWKGTDVNTLSDGDVVFFYRRNRQTLWSVYSR